MPTLSLSEIQGTGDFSSQNLYNTNVVQSANTGAPWFEENEHNPVGNPTETAHESIEHFGVTSIRFPGGQTDGVFADGMMPGGSLSDNIREILTYASENGLTIDMVVPVDTPAGMTRADFLSEMESFAHAIETEFPGVVSSYELGNEYWGGRTPLDASLERDYGHNAGGVAVALNAGLEAANGDADIYLQAAGNLRGAFGNDLDIANGDIQDGFGSVPGAKDALDGIIRNNYWKDPDLDGFENDTGTYSEDRGLEENLTGTINNWEDWLGRDYKTMVGEYNINKNIAIGEDPVDIGIHGASYLLEHMTNMIDAGVDVAYAWPIAHNTANAFIFRSEEITTQTVHGMEIATNSTRAAMLDLLRQTVDSHELIDGEWSFSSPAGDVEVTLYEDADGGPGAHEGERIVFLSSRSDTEMTFTADLSDFISSYQGVRGVSIYYEASGGTHRDAVVSEVGIVDPSNTGIFEVTLRPFEVLQFTFIYDTEAVPAEVPLPEPTPAPPPEPVPVETLGTDAEDRMFGTDGADIIIGLNGDDSLFGGAGDDTVMGDDGNDFIRGAAGSDRLGGGMGHDTLYGDAGHDELIGFAGWDVLDGGFGRDTLLGGGGRDVLSGGHGADRILGGLGHDRLSGNAGSDFLDGGHGNDQMFGNLGHDRMFGGGGSDMLRGGIGDDRLYGNAGDDLIFGGMDNDLLVGGYGADQLDGGSGADTLTGGAGDDELTGGTGADRFTFQDGHGNDRILDFEPEAGDVIDLSDVTGLLYGIDILDPLSGIVRQEGSDVIIETGANSSIVLEDTELSMLTPEHFFV